MSYEHSTMKEEEYNNSLTLSMEEGVEFEGTGEKSSLSL